MINNAILVGRLTKEPVFRTTPNNVATANFTLAVNRPFANKSGEKEADYISIVVWGKQAENVNKYITKGSLVAVTGRIQTRNYEGTDGKKVYVTEVVAERVQFLDNKKSSSNEQTPSRMNQNTNTEFEEVDVFEAFGQLNSTTEVQSQFDINPDDLPF